MKFPNKVNLYRNTVIYAISVVLNALDRPMKATGLYTKVQAKMKEGPLSFLDALACLYAMGKIEINDEEEIYKC